MFQKTSLASIMLLAAASGAVWARDPVLTKIDLSKTAVVLPFESEVKGAHGLPDATRTAVIQFLKDDGTFAAVLTPDDAQEKDKSTLVEISAKLVDFAPGNMATRVIVGLGTGRAHAGFEFTIRDAQTGALLWGKTITKTASFWSNSASSAAQRLELPEKVAKALVSELRKTQAK